MSIDTHLANAVEQAVEVLRQQEKFPVAVLAVKASKAAQANPHDAAIVTTSNVLTKMASRQTFITRAELNGIYEQLNSSNSKLADLFTDELGRKPLNGPTFFHRSESENTPLEHDYNVVTDPLLSNALSTIFDKAPEARLYSNATAERAEKSCYAQLLAAGFEPKSVKVFAGRGDFIVCTASYDTPKGESHVLVPVEVSDGKALLPTVFLTQAGFADIEPEMLKGHILTTAGKNFKVDGEKLLDVLAAAKYGITEKVSDVDMAVMKMKVASETPASHDPNGITYKQVDAANPNVAIPEVELDPEHETFAKRLASPRGIANHLFGKTAVDAGVNMLTRKMYDFGFGHTQVSVTGAEDDTVVYSVAVDRTAGFKVPVKVRDGLVMPPEILISAGNLSEFSREGIAEIMRSGAIDTRAIAQSSPAYGSKPSDLMQQVRDGISEGNLLKIEDAIDVLGEVDPEAQKRAIALFVESNNPETLKRVASEQHGCAMVVQNKASKHALCGHLNMPLHKVYQDKNGDCRPLYRKGMDETSEGGTFLAHKILHY